MPGDNIGDDDDRATITSEKLSGAWWGQLIVEEIAFTISYARVVLRPREESRGNARQPAKSHQPGSQSVSQVGRHEAHTSRAKREAR